ncbi:DUF4241 domain-containing protein [Paenibacillus azoreducens]|uniref:DUF4241 domain-containing protein n=1 Tax=Paenibacillus azoreducens TaxID=116718 RepID=UPI0039F58136
MTEYDKLRAAVTVQTVEDILTLPLVKENYNDYYDMDKNGYWDGRLFYGFRLPEQGPARLTVGEESTNENGEEDMLFFHYDIDVDEQGNKTVGLYCQEGNGHEKAVRPLCPGDMNTLKKALRYFERFNAKVRYDNKQYVQERERQNAESEAFEKIKEQYMQALMQQEDLVDRTCTLLGHTFRIITVKQADNLLNAIEHPTRDTPLYDILNGAWLHLMDEKPAYYLLSEENVHLQRLDMAQLMEEADRLHFTIAGCIFAANLMVDTFIEAYDTDYSPPMVVFGDLTGRHIALWGATFFVGGDVSCECLYGFYNHGQLVVVGTLKSGVIIADDFEMYFGKIGSNVLISNNDIYGIDKFQNESGSMIEQWTLYPSTYRAKDVLHDVMVDYDASPDGLWPDRSMLVRRFEEGGAVIDWEKLEQTYESFAEELPAAFDEIFHGWEQEGENLYKIKMNDSGSCFFFQSHEQEWKQAGFIDGTRYYILRVCWYITEQSWEMLYDVYNEQWELQYQFQTAPEDQYTSTLAVKKRFREALQALRRQRRPDGKLLDVLSMGEGHPDVQEVVRASDLYIPSGSIVAADPLTNMERPAFVRRSPVGTFPVYLYIERHYGRICCAEIRFSEDEVATWEMAVLSGQKVEELKVGEIFGYPVDTGLGCFMDEESARQLIKHQQELGEHYYDDYLSELLEGDEAISSDYCTAVPFPAQPHNAAVFRAGWGDGFYASYFALNEKGQVVRLITDFNCLGEHY